MPTRICTHYRDHAHACMRTEARSCSRVYANVGMYRMYEHFLYWHCYSCKAISVCKRVSAWGVFSQLFLPGYACVCLFVCSHAQGACSLCNRCEAMHACVGVCLAYVERMLTVIAVRRCMRVFVLCVLMHKAHLLRGDACVCLLLRT
jgi:hypothetical protein